MRNSKEYAQSLLTQIREMKPDCSLMEVCGTHTMAIAKAGLRNLLPETLRLLSGPGCPVCVTAQGDIDSMIDLADRKDVIITTFGDMIRVPGTGSSLQEKKSEGADIRVVYSPIDAMGIARENPDKEVVFIGIGFETTAPTVAATIEMAAAEGMPNFSVLSLHKVVPPALEAIFSDEEIKVDGLICPGHVSAVIGVEPYAVLADQFHKPSVVTGFEAIDILEGVLMLVQQLNKAESKVEIQYRRVVKPEGNKVAQHVIERVFSAVDARWRGLGTIPGSGLALRPAYEAMDAKRKFDLPDREDHPIKGCSCGEILKGRMLPVECALFGKGCTPLKPIGPCMVSHEGACAAYYRYGRR